MAAAPCLAQSINIDFGNGHGGPPADYAAAGAPGTWNVLTGPVSSTTPLVGLDGLPTAALIRITNGFGDLTDIPVAHPETGADQPLLGDGMLGSGGPEIAVDVEIFGLEDGWYRLINYTWYWPAEEYAQVAFVDLSPVVHPAGGPWPGQLTVGVTHFVHVVEITSAPELVEPSIRYHVVGDGPGSFYNGAILINGIQLEKIDEPIPCPADLDGSGTVDVNDFFDLIGLWGVCPLPPPGDCPGDLDGDLTVGTVDFFMLLAAWGPCPGTSPATCGDPGLADCLTPHGTPGCNDPDCCTALCGSDPFCCDVAWDELCAGVANLALNCAGSSHPNCGNSEATDPFTPSTTPGCDDVDCCNAVCDFDPFCCNYSWNVVCVEYAALFCSDTPPGCGHPGSGSCFDAHGQGENFTPYCDDEACCNTICASDPFCCDTLWDEMCVAQAHLNCDEGNCGPGSGPCLNTHTSGGCNDAACCFDVCSIVPLCCEDFDPQTGIGGWTPNCVDWALLLCVE
jgi:hypothetical protein